MSTTAAPTTSNTKKTWVKILSLGGMLTGFLLLAFLTGWYRDWEIWRMKKRLAQEKEYQMLRVKDGHADAFEKRTNPLITQASNGRNVNDRFNNRLADYEQRVGGVGIEAEQPGISLPAPITLTPEQLAQLPPTPTEVKCEPLNGGEKWTWPIKSPDWVKIRTLQPGDVVSADPNGRIADIQYPKYGLMGPEGLGYLCPNQDLRQQLPAPDAPPYALTAKLGEAGKPVALVGRFGKPLEAHEVSELYVRVNDLVPTNTRSGVNTNEGSVPVLIKKN